MSNKGLYDNRPVSSRDMLAYMTHVVLISTWAVANQKLPLFTAAALSPHTDATLDNGVWLVVDLSLGSFSETHTQLEQWLLL